ncbi:hypothetical protein SAMN05216367_4826 [Tardiphaga sp. OK245]|nr:hypothetical protein SAMN05216367_4826 [Tardiphaga sp. OK245]
MAERSVYCHANPTDPIDTVLGPRNTRLRDRIPCRHGSSCFTSHLCHGSEYCSVRWLMNFIEQYPPIQLAGMHSRSDVMYSTDTAMKSFRGASAASAPSGVIYSQVAAANPQETENWFPTALENDFYPGVGITLDIASRTSVLPPASMLRSSSWACGTAGNTEGADADLSDAQLRALSGHRMASMVVTYARSSMQQRRDGARKRQDARENLLE